MTESLADRAKRLQEQTRAFVKSQNMDAKYSRSARVREDLATTGRFTYQFWQGFLWVREWILAPITRVFTRIARWIFHQYMRLWFSATKIRTEDGMLLFSKTRAGVMVAATGLFIWYGLFPVLDCVYDTGLYALTVQHDEHLFLFNSQEIDPTTGMHNIEGADHNPWTEQDSIYFRAENSLFANLWSLTHKAALYYPEYVGAAVPTAISRCIVTTYGFRMRLPWLKNTYSYLLSVSCTSPSGHDG